MEYPDYKYLADLAFQAGRIMNRAFGMRGRFKDDGSPVTLADIAINKRVIRQISLDFPRISVIGEEGSREVPDAKYEIYCDPICGTIPFCLGCSVFSFCVSVVREQKPLIALIYDPSPGRERTWHAERGKGAFLNKDPVRVSEFSSLAVSAVCMAWWRDAPYNLSKMFGKLLKKARVCLNPAALAYFGGLTASGHIEATVYAGNYVWEAPAMQLIVEEAGGRFTDLKGNNVSFGKKRTICGHIASNGLVHEELVSMARECLE